MLNYKAIGRRIGIYRKKSGLTQANLAEKLEVSESYVSQIECGKAKISLPRVHEVADILKIDVSLLVSDKMKATDKTINSEVFEIIQDWPEDKLAVLVSLLDTASRLIKK